MIYSTNTHRWLVSLLFSTLFNLILFLSIPQFTYLKPIRLKKVYPIDLLSYVKDKSTLRQDIPKPKPENRPVRIPEPETENINPQAVETPTPPPEEKVYEINELDSIPQVLYMVKPEYPSSARHRGIEAQVVVKFLVNYYGFVEKVEVLKSTADIQYGFESCARDAVSKWKFTVPMVNNKPATVWFVLPIRFRLEE